MIESVYCLHFQLQINEMSIKLSKNSQTKLTPVLGIISENNIVIIYFKLDVIYDMPSNGTILDHFSKNLLKKVL